MSGEPAESIAPPGYVLGEKLGEGGFGQVFRAHHELMGRDVAIKVLHVRYSMDPEAIARFVAEARAVARISHPGIVEAFEFGALADGRQFCVMELVRGTTLRDVLRDRKRLPLDEALPILRAIAEAVDAAHAAGVAHRDLKPDNVFVLDGGGVKLIDFGLAKLVDDAEAPVTATGSMFGTPLYMSPEQCRGRTDARTDLYSFGAMAFHVLTGQAPFSGAPLELALHHLHDTPPVASSVNADLPARVDRTLAALLAKSPEDRPSPLVAAVDALAGLAKLRLRRRYAWLAVPVLVGLVAFVVWPRAASVMGDCASGEARIATAWDAPRRAALVARFASAKGPDVAAVERSLVKELDGYAAGWTRQWNAACVAPDRESAPLIYAQRKNCLDRGLIDFTAITDSVREIDPPKFARSYSGGLFAWTTPLSDCEREETLRALPPAPARERAAEVTAAIRRLYTARGRAREILNGNMTGSLDGPLGELDAVIAQLDALGVATAAEAAMIHAHYVSFAAMTREPARAEAAQRSIERAFASARKYRYDRVLADVYHVAIRYEVARGQSIPKLREWVAQLDDAYERAGHPDATKSGAGGHGELAILEGDFETANRSFQATLNELGPGFGELPPRVRLVSVLGYLGHHEDAIATAREGLRRAIDDWGPAGRNTLQARQLFAVALLNAGRFAEAREALKQTADISRSLGVPPAPLDIINEVIVDDALGLHDERDAAIDAFPVPPGSDRQLMLGVYADERGRFDLARELARRSTDPSAQFFLATMAVQYGDDAGAVAIVDSTPIASGPWGDLRPWVHALADAHAGRSAAVDAYLAKRAAAYGGPHGTAFQAMGGDILPLLALHRWDAARDLGARTYALLPEFHADPDAVAGVESMYGRALFESGDLAAARPHLERALFTIEASWVDATDLPNTAFALARLLAATNGDAARVRQLAQLAIASYGPFRTADRDAVQHWLDGLAK